MTRRIWNERMVKKKFYVVWEGRIPGIYDNWLDCKAQVEGFNGAKYKSFENKLEAEKQYIAGYKQFFSQLKEVGEKGDKQLSIDPKHLPIQNSICVDAACNMVTKVMEYRGVDTCSGKEIFHQGPFKGGSNNIGEFLALVHALALLKQQGKNMPIYSDSITAIAWVRNKKHKSIVVPTEENMLLFDLLERAEQWLRTHTYDTPIFKWDTKSWGEIPADFGRK